MKLFWLVVVGLGRIIGCYLKGDRQQAAEQSRALGIVVHDDLAQIISALQRQLPFYPTPTSAIERVLIVKLDRIGDLVCTTPVFDALRKAYPKARLDIVGHPVPLSLFDGDDRLGERILYRSPLYHERSGRRESPSALSLVVRLMRRRYPLVVYLRGSFPFLLLGATSRMVAAKFLSGEPVVTRYLKPLEEITGTIDDRQPRLYVDPGARRVAAELLFSNGGGTGPNIVIHALATTATKTWPGERFAAVADALVDCCKAKIHFLGSPADKPALERIAKMCSYAHSFHTALPLPQTVAVIASADLFIGNDSGLAHVAAAVGTPMVMPWGSVNLNMARPTAAAEKCAILYKDVACRSTCPEIYCANERPLECLTQISVDAVVQTAQHLLNQRMARSHSSQHEPTLSRS